MQCVYGNVSREPFCCNVREKNSDGVHINFFCYSKIYLVVALSCAICVKNSVNSLMKFCQQTTNIFSTKVFSIVYTPSYKKCCRLFLTLYIFTVVSHCFFLNLYKILKWNYIYLLFCFSHFYLINLWVHRLLILVWVHTIL